jgi:phospholipid/cholesterol/gamma-HCH transport system substrate-binding protein
MPRPRTYRRIIISGVVTLVVLAIAGLIARRTFLRYEFDLVTYLDNSSGISPASPVLLHGIPIGHVRIVSLSGSKDPARTVRIDMRFSRTYLPQIPEDSTIAIVASNLLGDKSLDIARGVHSASIRPGAEIRSTATQDIASVLERGNEPLAKVDSILAHVDRIMKSIDQDEGTAGLLIGDKKLPNGLLGITADMKAIQTRFKSGQGAALRLTEIETEAKKPMARLDGMMADLNSGKGTIGLLLHDPNDPPLLKQANLLTAEGRQMMNDLSKDKRPGEIMSKVRMTSDKAVALTSKIQKGQGTLGLLLTNPELRDSLKRINSEYDSFVADFSKHPIRFVELRFGLF